MKSVGGWFGTAGGLATQRKPHAPHWRDMFRRFQPAEVLSYTAPDNSRSQSVMRKLGLERDTARDFVASNDLVGEWRGLVWVAKPADFKTG